MSLFGNSVHQQVFVTLVLIGSICSSFASMLMLLIIYKLKVWNGHILLVVSMTVFQFVYDATFFTGMIDVGNEYVTIISNVLQLFSGVTSSLVSNLVAWITFYVIYYKKGFDIFRYYSVMMLIVVLPAIADCALFLCSIRGNRSEYFKNIAVLYVYYYLKLVSIIFNFVLGSITFYEIRRIRSGKERLTKSESSLNTLSMRLFYYPIVQSISRIGFAWYEFSYQYDNSSSGGMNFNPSNASDTQFAAQCLLAITMPIASIGYLFIFLLMQPRAYRTLLKIFGKEVVQETPQQEMKVEDAGQDDDEMGVNSMRSLVSFSSESQLRFSLIEGDFF